MTKRRLTKQEEQYNAERKKLLESCNAEYIADAPFLFLNRVQTIQTLSRIELFKMVMDIPGAIIECGVYRGNALMLYLQLSIALEPYAINRSIYGFDTFDGFDSISTENDPKDINTDMFSDTNFELLKNAIQINDLVRPTPRVPRCELIRGEITKTVPEFSESHPELVTAMLILDVDLYEPTKAALETFLPSMPKGGIVVLDEVCYRNFMGETMALKEVLDMNKVELKRFPYDTSVGYFRVGM
jgi:hypothetical protein